MVVVFLACLLFTDMAVNLRKGTLAKEELQRNWEDIKFHNVLLLEKPVNGTTGKIQRKNKDIYNRTLV